MAMRALVQQSAVVSACLTLMIAALLVLSGHSSVAAGLIYGTAVGALNLVLLAVRVTQVGELGSVSRAKRTIQVGMGLRLLMIGLAAGLIIRLASLASVYGMLLGLLLTIAVSNVLGARYFLRGIY